MKNLFYSFLKYGFFIWLIALLAYYSICSHNQIVTRKVEIQKIEKGNYSTNLLNYFYPYDVKISVSDDKIGAIFATSDMKGFYQIKENDSLWVELYCLESNSWSDFFLMSFNFNYELFSIPNQADQSLEQDDLIFTSSFWVHVFFVCMILLALYYRYDRKRRSKK